jgi:nucleotide-binding universal stress UspA family protein
VEIVREAEQWRADLVVLGRWSRSPGAPVRLGPTSDVVIRRRNGASLFVPGSVCCIRRVLIALDGTDRGLGILHGAASVVAALGATPIAVCVLSGALPGEPDSADPRAGRVSEALNRTEGLSGRTTVHILHGEPVPKILSLLEESRSDLLVVGVRGGGPQGEMGSGHVGRDLLQAVPAAILSIPI